MFAITAGHQQIVRFLINHGADLDARGKVNIAKLVRYERLVRTDAERSI
jgi:hypothetical protein